MVVRHSEGSNGHVHILKLRSVSVQNHPDVLTPAPIRNVLVLSGAQYAYVAHTEVPYMSFPLLLSPVVVFQIRTTAEAGELLLYCPTTLCSEE